MELARAASGGALTTDYQVYGLTLRASRRLPHLLTASNGDSRAGADIRLHVQSQPGSGEFLRVMFGDRTRGLHFTIDPAGRDVWANFTEAVRPKSINSVASLLIGTVLGAVLRLRGTVSLHGCVLQIGSRAVVLVGPGGSGKSTLAAMMAHRGHAVLSDDVAALVEPRPGSWLAQPGYPRLRLRPDAFDAIDTSAAPVIDAGPVPGFGKRYLELLPDAEAGPWRFQTKPLAVDAVYELRRDGGADGAAIEPISGAGRLLTVLRHRRAALAPLDAAARSAELARLGRLAAAVPVRRVTYPDDLHALPAVCEAIAADATVGLAGD